MDVKIIERIFRENSGLAISLRNIIWRYVEKLGRTVKIMNFCGTHEWTTVHFGIRSLMPPGLELVAGPGCPVCITPSYYIEKVIELSFEGVTVYTFGDAYKLPALRPVKGARSLEEARALGGEVKVVYSFLDAIKEHKKDVGVFLGIGFETTSPSYAIPLKLGKVPDGLYFLSVLRLTPPAAEYAIKKALEKGVTAVQGIIAPGHVTTVTGAKPWLEIAEKYSIPTVVSGFEPIDLLISIARILKMLYEGRAGLEIEYKRAVTLEGNIKAKRAIEEVFTVVDSAWRGLGFIPKSGLKLRESFSKYDALTNLGIKPLTPEEWKYDLPPACKCAEVTLGLAKPTDCPLFMKACTPKKPWGPCMVSMEGTCAVWARFGGGGLAEEVAKDLGIL